MDTLSKVSSTSPGQQPRAELDAAIQRADSYLLGRQSSQGYWVGNLEADASVAAGYIPLMYLMQGGADPLKQSKVVTYLKDKQNSDGSWSSYFGGEGDLNVTAQVYFALKLAGQPASSSEMQKARDFVLSRGGLAKTNTITRVWLAVFGQFDYRGVPSIPAELIFLPRWFYLNLYEFASWSRETIMALIMVLNKRPVCPLPGEARISELFVDGDSQRQVRPAERGGWLSWKSLFLAADAGYKFLERIHLLPFKQAALRRVEKWVVEHQENDGSWGGIMLPWVYSLIGLKSLGYSAEHPVIRKGLEGLAGFLVEDERSLWLQPATSPVWDTAWACLSLLQAGLSPEHPALLKAGRWLLDQEVRTTGDWKIKNPSLAPGGWAFEFANQWYPDIDDTAVVARALGQIKLENAKTEAILRGEQWIRNMQGRDGGWAAFDKDNNKRVLSGLPYGDFMTPLDPASPDVTAHALELISESDARSPAARKAVRYLKNSQEDDGSWFGRWGVNYLYGTGLVLVSLKAAGEDLTQACVLRALAWLKSKQNPDGGWGESCHSYVDPRRRGQGDSTASQTAWALMGLMCGGRDCAQALRAGADYLLHEQNRDGNWKENFFTGTGFPRAFYLRYDLYRSYFPLLALGQYRSWREENDGK
jgi:squalene-hopene/tetraprenyl-beta-curcumene cyclase